MTDFNPFEKDLQYLNLTDIEQLKTKQITEGLFIEYKSDFPSNQKISRSIASFANSHGGWYFIGIKTNIDNVPTEFVGFDTEKLPNPKEKFRDIITSHVNPVPLYFSKLLEISEKTAILIVYVPEGSEPPYFTKDGIVYRRSGEASEPIRENDRYTIDKLYDKSKRFEETINNFCRNSFIAPKTQNNQGWLELFFVTYPLEKLYIENMLLSEKIDKLKLVLNSLTEIKTFNPLAIASGNIPFNNLATTHNSLIFRQTTSSNLGNITLTFELFFNGNAKIIIPFQYVIPSENEKSEVLRFMENTLGENDGMPNIFKYSIIDGLNLSVVFLSVLNKYQELLVAEGWTDKIIIKYKLNNCWRHILYFESPTLIDHINKYGIPVLLRDSIELPSFFPQPWFIRSFDKFVEGGLSDFSMIAASFGYSITSFTEAMSKGLQNYFNKTKPK